MATITNAGKQPRAFHVQSKGNFVEIDQGQSIEVTAEDLKTLKSSPAFVASCGPGALVIDGDEGEADGEPKPKAKRGRKSKADAAHDDDGEGDEGDATGGE